MSFTPFIGPESHAKLSQVVGDKWEEFPAAQHAEYISLTTPEFREYDRILHEEYFKWCATPPGFRPSSTLQQQCQQTLAERIAIFNSIRK